MNSLVEKWRPVTGKVEGYSYEVSNQGRVRSLNKEPRGKYGRILKPTINLYGYCQVSLRKGRGTQKCCQIHLLVAEAFLGVRPKGCETNHKNGVKSDNRLENLEWMSPFANHHHAVRLGLRDDSKGSKPFSTKLNATEVVTVRQKFAEGATLKALANEYGLCICGIRLLVSGKTWKNAGGPITLKR